MPSLPAQALETLALQLLDPGLDAVLRLVVLIVLIQRQPAEGALIQQSLQITPSSTASWYAGCIAGAVYSSACRWSTMHYYTGSVNDMAADTLGGYTLATPDLGR